MSGEIPNNLRCPKCGYVSADVFNCVTCKGTGAVPEYHGPGLTEMLGCDDCEGTGCVSASVLGIEDVQKTLSALENAIAQGYDIALAFTKHQSAVAALRRGQR